MSIAQIDVAAAPNAGTPDVPPLESSFVAHLLAGYGRDGERRAQRQDGRMGPVASESYDAVRRLPGELEPGFLVRRDI